MVASKFEKIRKTFSFPSLSPKQSSTFSENDFVVMSVQANDVQLSHYEVPSYASSCVKQGYRSVDTPFSSEVKMTRSLSESDKESVCSEKSTGSSRSSRSRLPIKAINLGEHKEVVDKIVEEMRKMSSLRDITSSEDVSLSLLHKVFVSFGMDSIEALKLRDCLRSLLDQGERGYITASSLRIQLAYIFERSTKCTIRDFGFQLFGADANRRLPKIAMMNMIELYWGNNIDRLMETKNADVAFGEFLESRQCAELFRCYKALSGKLVKETMSTTSACDLHKTYIAVEAEDEVNVSDKLRTDITKSLEEATNSGAEIIDSSIFEPILDEVRKLMETGHLGSFVQEIKQSNSFIDAIWEHFGLAQEDTINFSLFGEWLIQNPTFLKFFHSMQKQIKNLNEVVEKSIKAERKNALNKSIEDISTVKKIKEQLKERPSSGYYVPHIDPTYIDPAKYDMTQMNYAY